VADSSFDVLVIGSGASGLAAAVSAHRAGARVAVATKGALQSCNSAKAQGGIQAAFGADDSPEQHAEDVWNSSHETADRHLVEILTVRGAVRDPLARGARRRVHRGERRLPARPLRRRLAQAPAAGRRPDRARDHDRAARRGRELRHPHLSQVTARRARTDRERLARALRGPHDRRHDGGPRSGRAVLRVAQERGELSTNHPGATGEVTQMAVDLGAELRDFDALQYHPNGGAWPQNMQGYSIPETTRAYGAVLLNADGEEFTDSLGPRDAVSQAIFDEVEKGRGVETPDGRPAVYLDTTRIEESDANVSLPYMLRRYRAGGIDPLQERIFTYPVLHYQNGGLVIDSDAQTTVEGLYACGEIAGGTHGRNRMMGNSLLECCVFGRRAGKAAAAA
jgi:succinate dehydrogenase / fumarate reductase flavoprotein subunit/L-aspartate oxidase